MSARRLLTNRVRLSALWLVLAGSIGSCTTNRGGLLIEIEKDGDVEIDSLSVQVISKGVELLANDYQRALPTNLAIVSNGDSTASVQIAIIGWRGKNPADRTPVDRRDHIVTQVPTDRTAVLTVTLSALCSAKVNPSTAESLCSADETCNPKTGDCVPNGVDGAQLPSVGSVDSSVGGQANGGQANGGHSNGGGGSSNEGDDAGSSGEREVGGDPGSGSAGAGGASHATAGGPSKGGGSGSGGSSGKGGASTGGASTGGASTGGTSGNSGSGSSSGQGGTSGGGTSSGGSSGKGGTSAGGTSSGGGKGGGGNGGTTSAGGAGAANAGAGGAPPTKCGNGSIDSGEACDDANALSGDGCSACVVEANYFCDNTVSPSSCTLICGSGATCHNSPSCVGLPKNCSSTRSDDCCAALAVPGGQYTRGAGTTPDTTVSAFVLDKYEVTVGRFRKFLAQYKAYPTTGTGAHPGIAGSGWDPAWNGAQVLYTGNNAYYPTIGNSKASLTQNYVPAGCGQDPATTFPTYDDNGVNDRLPMNCVNWYEAFAFCAWDGGWLPTEAEFEFAAGNGSEKRTYAWGNTPVPNLAHDAAVDYAMYLGYPSTPKFSDIVPAGSKPLGAGKFAQFDLTGSMAEWAFDALGDFPVPCNNCALVNFNATGLRILRGGGWQTYAPNLTVVYRTGDFGAFHNHDKGLRCARSQ